MFRMSAVVAVLTASTCMLTGAPAQGQAAPSPRPNDRPTHAQRDRMEPDQPAPAPRQRAGHARAGQPGVGRPHRPGQQEARERIKQRFDADQNGRLNQGERRAARHGVARRMKERRPMLFDLIDRNGDGRIDRAERRAVRQLMREHQREVRGQRSEVSRQRPDGARKHPNRDAQSGSQKSKKPQAKAPKANARKSKPGVEQHPDGWRGPRDAARPHDSQPRKKAPKNAPPPAPDRPL